MIKVLYLIDTMSRSGTQTHIARMLRRHDRSRFRPYLLCVQEKGPLGEELEAEGYPVTAYGLKRIYACKAALSYARLIGFLRRERIDVVHCYLFAAQVYGIPVARVADVPLVIAGRRAVGAYWTSAVHMAARRISNHLSHLQIANSLAVKEYVVREEGVVPDKVRVVYNGIDSSRFSPSDRGRCGGEGDVTVGYVGNITRVKRLDLLLRAVRRAIYEYPRLRVVIVGEGPGRARRLKEGETGERIRRLTDELGLTGRVVFTGHSTRVEDELRAMDIFVLPSVSEGMSNAMLEAMSAELPVIATDQGGNREVVVEGETGYLFPFGDVERLTACMLDLIHNRGKRQEMGRKGRLRVLERFTIDRMVSDMEEIYLGELARRKAL